MLLRVALYDTIGTHVHVEVEFGHRCLQALNVEPAFLILALDFFGGLLEILNQRHHTTGCVQVGIIVLVLNHDTRLPWGAVKCGIGIIGY